MSGPPELAVVVAGVLLIAVAVAWRLVRHHGIDTRIAAALRDPDPAVRRAAVRVAGEQGMRPYASLLAARIDVEADPSVRAELVGSVLRNAWEPADRPAILRLRLWAHQEHARSRQPTTPRVPTAAEPARHASRPDPSDAVTRHLPVTAAPLRPTPAPRGTLGRGFATAPRNGAGVGSR